MSSAVRILTSDYQPLRPDGTPWSYLRQFENAARAGELREVVMGSPAPRAVGRTIAALIRQAREYSEAAAAASRPTSAILLYYSSEALAKAIIALRTGALVEAEIKTHGLARNGEARVLMRRAARVQAAGVFPSLVDATRQSVGMAIPDGFIESESVTSTGLRGLSLTFADIVEFTPNPSQPVPLRVYPAIVNGGRLRISLTAQSDEPPFTVRRIRSRLPRIRSYRLRRVTDFIMEFDIGGPSLPQTYQREHVTPLFGENLGGFVVGPVKRFEVNPLCVQFAGLFILADVARYRPRLWMESWYGMEKNADTWIVDDFLDFVAKEFPRLAWSYLRGHPLLIE